MCVGRIKMSPAIFAGSGVVKATLLTKKRRRCIIAPWIVCCHRTIGIFVCEPFAPLLSLLLKMCLKWILLLLPSFSFSCIGAELHLFLPMGGTDLMQITPICTRMLLLLLLIFFCSLCFHISKSASFLARDHAHWQCLRLILTNWLVQGKDLSSPFNNNTWWKHYSGCNRQCHSTQNKISNISPACSLFFLVLAPFVICHLVQRLSRGQRGDRQSSIHLRGAPSPPSEQGRGKGERWTHIAANVWKCKTSGVTTKASK